MKKSTILDILKNIDISDRYKNYSKNTNKMNVEFDKKIILSEETESFYSLLEENKEQKDHLIFFCDLVYLDNNNNDK